jgi:hypothetical protein
MRVLLCAFRPVAIADDHAFCEQILGAVFPLFGLQMYNTLGLVSGSFSYRNVPFWKVS